MLKRLTKLTFRIVSYAAVLGLLTILLTRMIFLQSASTQTFSKEDAPVRQVAIVFGAQVRRNGMPSAVLRDRIETAVALYTEGKVEKLLMSGDNRFGNYNEPEAMRQYALSAGVPDEAIVLDYAGRRTYDTCYRAKAIFGVKKALLVTQGFHLPRAVFLCNMLGMDTVG